MSENSNSQDAVCVARFKPGCEQLLFLYQGRAGMLFIPPLQFLRFCGAARRNLVMFRDLGSNHYHGELHPDWPDIETTIRRQQRIRADCTYANQLYCVGTSAGAYAAILFGHYLEADTVYAFGAQTQLDKNKLDPDNDVPAAHLDLASLLAEGNGRTRYKLYYAEDYEPDRVAAQRLADCPGVELHPLPGNEHNVFTDVNPEKLLGSLLPPLEEPDSWTAKNS